MSKILESVAFYHLTTLPIEKALPKLLEKIVTLGSRSVLWISNQELLSKVDDLLWTYSSRTFLPHGTAKSGFANKQPIYLSNTPENPNNAEIILTIEGNFLGDISLFKRGIDMFDGSDSSIISNARNRWTQYKQLGTQNSYFKETEEGKWTKGL